MNKQSGHQAYDKIFQNISGCWRQAPEDYLSSPNRLSATNKTNMPTHTKRPLQTFRAALLVSLNYLKCRQKLYPPNRKATLHPKTRIQQLAKQAKPTLTQMLKNASEPGTPHNSNVNLGVEA